MKAKATKRAKSKAKSSPGGMRGAIDPHTHCYPEAFAEDVRRGRFGSALVTETSNGSEFIVARGRTQGRDFEVRVKLTPRNVDPEVRFKDMKRMGVERQILSVNPQMALYTLEASVTKELAISVNDSLSALARQYPDKFSCMAAVPLQDPPAASAELERAHRTGHIGVGILSNVAGMNLHDPSLDVFWAKVSELDLTVFIHPQTVLGGTDRLREFHLKNLIGNPLDTSIAAACLIFGGVLDRYPKLRFYLSHMGGFVPWIRGRWQHGYKVREEPKIHGAKDPEKYIRRFYYDTIIHNPNSFELAVKTVGSDRIAYGTDYPADMGYHQPARAIPGLSRFSKTDQEKILFRNANKLYKL